MVIFASNSVVYIYLTFCMLAGYVLRTMRIPAGWLAGLAGWAGSPSSLGLPGKAGLAGLPPLNVTL